MTRLLIIALVGMAACGGYREGTDARPWQTETRIAGDTTVVSTSAVQHDAATVRLEKDQTIGTTEGTGNYSFAAIKEFSVGPSNEVFIFDRQFVQLRQYDSSGTFVRAIGTRGTGPGEYERINGIAVHDDGRFVIWNATNATINQWTQEKLPTANWKVPGGASFNTSNAIMVDTAGNTYIRTRVGDPPPSDNMAVSGRMFGITGLLRYSKDGSVVDSLRPPDIIIDAPRLIASVEGNTSMSPVPFSTQFIWTFSPYQAFVSGRSDVYAIDISTFDGMVTRIEMEGDRPRVSAAEKEENEIVTIANMRTTDPNWKWNGAPIPEVKPYFKQILVGRDGRIWISLSQPSVEIPEAELPEPSTFNDIVIPVRKLREPVVYDVFERNGNYFGRVELPPRNTWRAANGNYVWTVARDSLDIEQITRYRMSK